MPSAARQVYKIPVELNSSKTLVIFENLNTFEILTFQNIILNKVSLPK